MRRGHGAKKRGQPSRTALVELGLTSDYRLTSLTSLVGSPDGLLVSAVQVALPLNTRETLEMLHWSSVASASTLPTAPEVKTGFGGVVTASVVEQAAEKAGLAVAVEYLNTSTWIPSSVVCEVIAVVLRISRFVVSAVR